MKAPMDKHYDDLTKKIVVSADLEQPSEDFTQTLMSKIEALPQRSLSIYKPVISKPMLYLLGLGFVGLILFLVLSSETTSLGWVDPIDFSFLSSFSLSGLFDGVEVSKTVLYSVVAFGAMLWIQVGLLKRRHDNSFSV